MLPNMKPLYPGVLPALKDYFGMRDGQNLQDFAAECRALTPADKEWFKQEFEKHGIKFGA